MFSSLDTFQTPNWHICWIIVDFVILTPSGPFCPCPPRVGLNLGKCIFHVIFVFKVLNMCMTNVTWYTILQILRYIHVWAWPKTHFVFHCSFFLNFRIFGLKMAKYAKTGCAGSVFDTFQNPFGFILIRPNVNKKNPDLMILSKKSKSNSYNQLLLVVN